VIVWLQPMSSNRFVNKDYDVYDINDDEFAVVE
jgi:hypothetical protein